MPPAHRPPTLIVHIIYHFGVGGMENGLINLLNQLPVEKYRHVIVSLCTVTDFSLRLKNKNVEVLTLNRPAGIDLGLYFVLWKLLRRLRPALVHTRNLATLECQISAAFSGCKLRVHGEHGRDIFDLAGESRKYNLLRRLIRPFISAYIAVSKDLESWLINSIGAKPQRVKQIYNGVDSTRFFPRDGARQIMGPPGFMNDDSIVIGSVGRMAKVKNYPALVEALDRLIKWQPELAAVLRLVIVGDGPTREQCLAQLKNSGLEQVAWLPGAQSDIATVMRAFDIFVLPSLGEGISNTILEAMASGLPVVATQVGGNPELIIENQTGLLVPAGDIDALARALQKYCADLDLRHAHGLAARRRIEQEFSITAMIEGYMDVYDTLLGLKRASTEVNQ